MLETIYHISFILHYSEIVYLILHNIRKDGRPVIHVDMVKHKQMPGLNKGSSNTVNCYLTVRFFS